MSGQAPGAYGHLRTAVIADLEREQLDPTTDLDRIRDLIESGVRRWQRSAHLGEHPGLRDPADMVGRLLSSVTAYGPLTELLTRTDVEEVFVEGDRVTYLDGSGRLQGLAAPTTEQENRQVVDRLLASTQRHLDAANPMVQARVLDGTARLTAAIAPVAECLSATLRRSTLRRDTLSSLVDRGSLTPGAAGLLWAVMQTRSSVLVSGPPGAGKTSLLSALLAAVPSTRCIRCCEEIRELHVPVTHGSFYEARPPGMDGTPGIGLRELVKFVLSMRPDHIIVGEVRGAEAFELTRAVNAGCPVFTSGPVTGRAGNAEAGRRPSRLTSPRPKAEDAQRQAGLNHGRGVDSCGSIDPQLSEADRHRHPTRVAVAKAVSNVGDTHGDLLPAQVLHLQHLRSRPRAGTFGRDRRFCYRKIFRYLRRGRRGPTRAANGRPHARRDPTTLLIQIPVLAGGRSPTTPIMPDPALTSGWRYRMKVAGLVLDDPS